MVAENFRPGVMEKLGLGYETLKARKPSLIYASASGYGPDGPYVEKPGQDLLAQALFGMMAITGQAATGPRPAGASVIDHHGAALFAMGILAAIVRRQRTGQGCRVDASLMQAALDLQAESLVAWINAPTKPPARPGLPPRRRLVLSRRPTAFTPPRTAIWRCRCRRSKVLAEGHRRAAARRLSPTRTPGRKQDEITELIAQRLETATTAEWVARMEPLKIWHAPVQGYAQIVEDPQVKHMKSLVTVPGAGEDRRAGDRS